VTHDQEEALAVSDKIIVMNRARIAQEGTPSDLYDRPADAFVADFIGGANLVACEVTAVEDGVATVRLGDLTLSVRAGAVGKGPGLAVIRPSTVDLLAAPAAGRSLSAQVSKATYLGSHWEYTLDTPIGELFVMQPVESRHEAGATVHVVLAPEQLALVARPNGGG
jgi:iron(III) transport system ATP-binding protein